MSIKDDWYSEQTATGLFRWLYHFSGYFIRPVVYPGDIQWKFAIQKLQGTTWSTLVEGDGDTLELTMEAALCAWREVTAKEKEK